MKNKKIDKNRYDDMIHMPHHTSPIRPRMSVADRSAQFSPFAALTGHGAAIEETARLTEEYIELDEYEKIKLDEKLKYIQEHISEQPEVTITYFVPDKRKEGGLYLTITGCVKKIEEYDKCIVMQDGSRIGIDRILALSDKHKGGNHN